MFVYLVHHFYAEFGPESCKNVSGKEKQLFKKKLLYKKIYKIIYKKIYNKKI